MAIGDHPASVVALTCLILQTVIRLNSMLITLAERRIIPDAVIRVGIRRLLDQRLQRERAEFPRDAAERVALLRRQFAAGPIAEQTDAARRQHYEAPTELFVAMLGPRLKYSGCLWEPGVDNLAAAEEAMLALTCARAGIEDGQRILDLGCGWGSLSLWMAERYPNAEIIAVSNSRTQHQFISEQALARGLFNLKHVVLNVADFAKETVGRPASNDADGSWRFDRIVSVEMFEHMRNVDRLLQHLGEWLHVDGRLFVHNFCHRDLSYRFVDEHAGDWMARHFFTGGAMPPLDLFAHVSGPFAVEQRWEVNGLHYAKTCRGWLENLDNRRAEILRRFQADLSLPEARRQFQRWRMFVMACEELFAYDGGRQWLVSHHLLALE
jgi:cyclopropane-fatty-acyl-phospholipid synthase